MPAAVGREREREKGAKHLQVIIQLLQDLLGLFVLPKLHELDAERPLVQLPFGKKGLSTWPLC